MCAMYARLVLPERYLRLGEDGLKVSFTSCPFGKVLESYTIAKDLEASCDLCFADTFVDQGGEDVDHQLPTSAAGNVAQKILAH